MPVAEFEGYEDCDHNMRPLFRVLDTALKTGTKLYRAAPLRQGSDGGLGQADACVTLLKRYFIDSESTVIESPDGDYVEYGDLFAWSLQLLEAIGQQVMCEERERAWKNASSLTIYNIRPPRSPKYDEWFEAGWTACASSLRRAGLAMREEDAACEVCAGTGVAFGKRCECSQ
jgi:hypothetical protein